jgi:GH15 family glucan-1,4-alpha-glucosidase
MYGLAGEKRLTEWEVSWLSGYEGSKPVRIGNAASDQLQVDVFGEVMDALHMARVGGVQDLAEGWDFQRALLCHLEKVWSSADDGIWEVGRERQHFAHSKAMAWGRIRPGDQECGGFRLEGPIGHWRNLRAEIHAVVCEAFNRSIGAFVQAFGSDQLDASTLLIPAVASCRLPMGACGGLSRQSNAA